MLGLESATASCQGVLEARDRCNQVLKTCNFFAGWVKRRALRFCAGAGGAVVLSRWTQSSPSRAALVHRTTKLANACD